MYDADLWQEVYIINLSNISTYLIPIYLSFYLSMYLPGDECVCPVVNTCVLSPVRAEGLGAWTCRGLYPPSPKQIIYIKDHRPLMQP